MNNKILNFINNNEWDTAINNLKNLFSPIYNQKTLFHYACLRGNKKIIDKYLATKSEKIFLSDNDGNTGCHFLAYGEWDQILIEVTVNHPTFLKLKNSNDDFVCDLVKDRVNTLEKIIDIMIKNNMVKYLNFVKNNDRTFILDLIDTASTDDSYLKLLHNVLQNSLNLSLPKSSPPLIYSMVNKYDKISFFMLDKLKTNVNIKTDHQVTPLHIALLQKHTDLIKSVLKLNPDVNYAGFENKNVPLSMCWKFGLIDIADQIMKVDNIDFNKSDALLNTPIYYLIYLIAKNRLNFTKTQASKCKTQLRTSISKSNLENLNINHETPLHLLIKYKLWDIYKEDISKKTLNLNTVSKINESPISLLSEDELHFLIDSQSSSAYELLEQNIVLPQTSSNNDNQLFGLFNADGIHNIIYMFVMLSKYTNLTIPTQANIYDKKRWDMYKTLSHCIQTSETVIMTHSLISLYHTTFYRVIPAIIIWKDKNLFYCTKDTVYLERCISVPTSITRFVMLRITLVLENSSLHANIVIYDKLLNKLIRFEPYGDWEFCDSYNLDQMLIKMFTKSLDPKKQSTLKYIRPRDYLDKTKFQTTSLGDHFIEKNLGDPVGYCLAWCFWFLELKLNNPESDENQLVNLALNKIIKTNKDHNNTNPLLTHIRSYAKELDRQKNILLEKMGVPKVDMYKMSYGNQKLELIKNFVESYNFI